MPGPKLKTGRVNFRKVIFAAGVVGAVFFTSACSASEAASPTGTSSPSGSASAAAAPSATPSAVTFPYTLPNGLVAKGVANDGHGDYIQTSIADTDPAMKYNPAITDDAAKAHFSEADLAEAQKVIVRFIAEEAIDSTLNDGTDVDAWWAAHLDQIHPGNMVMLTDMKSSKDILARERWMATKPGFSYAHGDKPRVTRRTITPVKLGFVENGPLQGVMLGTTASYSMAVTSGPDQNSTAELTFTAAKDPADGKWKIAGYNTNYHTAQLLK
ncbi:hypothetical protein [Arthrobacter sp. fls2-241-R2A-200]|uniref:hypothetical protein n=1 Tax=Arthrobacter sp. fls2-241-R2A-200 TaxID=3040281 RepID=UPI002550BCFC|nr:hypothetical protein [Arthrobacter sp. fls2-241-R2A-200]